VVDTEQIVSACCAITLHSGGNLSDVSAAIHMLKYFSKLLVASEKEDYSSFK
jgi:hypothetical protein